MKKIIFIGLCCLAFQSCLGICLDRNNPACGWGSNTQDEGNYHSAISSDEKQVVNTDNISSGRILQGQQAVAGEGSGIVNVINSDSKTTNQATNDMLKYISAFINWALGMLFFVALGFLIYNGYLVVTAAGNDAQYKKGMGYVKYMAIGIVGIGLSFFIIQFIFAIIFKVT